MKLYAELLQELGRADEGKELSDRADALQNAAAEQVNARRTGSRGVLKIGGDVSVPAVLQKMDPAHTDEARAAKVVPATKKWTH